MASRVNTRFVVILVAVIVGLTAIGGVALWATMHASAEDDLQRGLALLQSGNVVDAKKFIGKAVNKRRDDIKILNSYIDVLERMPSKDSQEAKQNCTELSRALATAIAQQPGQSAPLERYCRFYLHLGRGVPDNAIWDPVYDAANTFLKSYPNNLTAQKFRGMALVNRMRMLDVRPDDRRTAQTDLQAVLLKTPDDFEVQYHLALWNILTARSLQSKDPDLAAQMEKEARDLAGKLVEGHPDDVERLLDQIRIYKELRDEPKATAALGQLETAVLAHPPVGMAMADVVGATLAGDTTPVDRGPDQMSISHGVQRAHALVLVALKAQPDDIFLNYSLGELLRTEGDSDGAISVYRRVRELKIPNTPVDAQISLFLQRLSCFAQADLLLGKLLDTKTDVQQKAGTREEATKLIEYLKSTSPEGPMVNSLLGKLAVANEQWALASKYLDQAISQYGKAVNVEVLMLAAKACEGQGDIGAAIDRLGIVVQNNPKFPPARYELVRLYMQLHRLPEASVQVNTILDTNPRDRIGLQLKANIFAQQGKYEEALSFYQRLDPEHHPELAVPMAGVYFAEDKKDEAHQVLDKAFALDPRNLQVLKLLLDLDKDDKAKCLAYLDKADAVAIEKAKPALNALRMLVEGKDLLDVQRGIVDREADPVKRALRLYAMFLTSRKTDEAAKALADARRLAPDNFDVLAVAFDDALRRKDFADAKQLADRAAKLNADAVQGNVYAGRLATAQERFDDAVNAFQRAVSLRPSHSDTFVLLGDAQRRANLMDQAIDSYRKAAELNPANLLAVVQLAEVLDSRDQYFEAMDALHNAVLIAPKNEPLVEQYLAYVERHGDVRVALQFRKDHARDNPKDSQNVRAMAALLGRMKNYPEAVDVINGLIATEGKTPANLAVLANLRYEEKGKDEGIKVIEDRIRELADKATSDYFVTLGRFLFTVGENERGVDVFRKAIALQDKAEMPASRELGDVLFERRQFAQAAEFYQQVWAANNVASGVGPRYAEALIRSGSKDRLDEARAVLTAVKDASGDTASTRTLQGLIAWVQNDLVQADKLLREAVRMAPERPALHYQLGEFLAPQPGMQREAAAEFRRAVALDPRMIMARMALVQLALHQHDSDEAIPQLLEALHWNPMFVPARQMLGELYLAKGDRKKLGVLLQESANLFPKEPTWLKLQARLAVQDGQYAEAIKTLRQALELANTPGTATELALALLGNKQPDEALKLLAAPSTALMYAAKARALFVLGQAEPAKASLLKALEMAADYTGTSAVVDQVVLAVGAAEAIKTLDSVPVPYQKVLWVQLLIAGQELDQGAYASAVARLQRLNPAEGADQIVRERLLAVALAKTNKFTEARQAYERILKTDPDHVATLNNLGYLLIDQLNDLQNGMRYAQRANDLAPGVPELVDTLGWGQFKQGRKEAVDTLRHSVELRPTASNCYHLARAILETGGSKIAAQEKAEQAKALGIQNHDLEFQTAAEQLLIKLAQPMR